MKAKGTLETSICRSVELQDALNQTALQNKGKPPLI